jgi:hypothetical protein
MKCDFTDVETEDYVMVGFLPGLKANLALANTKEAKVEYRRQMENFRETEANCNTCRHLIRVPHKKDSAGFLRGKCTQLSSTGYPIAIEFHPDDPMHMRCYEGR